MRGTTKFGIISLALGSLLALLSFGAMASPWYLDGGVVGWLQGHKLHGGEEALLILLDCGFSIVIGVLLLVAGFWLRAFGWGGLLGGALASKKEASPKTKAPSDHS
ncbi:MAG TPA: hypothetical protein PLN21_05950 [Gemmatales bacterium]|nr:hypothetical protein [Gemmatales bacterium]